MNWIDILFTLGIGAVIAIVRYLLKISSSGIIANVNIKVYSDAAGTIPLSSLSWGTVYPESTAVATLYVKNIGTVNSKLTFTQSDFIPTTASVLLMTTDYNGASIVPNQLVTVKLTLTIPTAAQLAAMTNFSFVINIQSTSG
jgi:hypothetical protein